MESNTVLFVPLKTVYYNKFLAGEKRDELRLYGKRWNEKTCYIGRAMVLSKGYGKKSRVHTEVAAFKKRRGSMFDADCQASIIDVYGSLDVDIAIITPKQPLQENLYAI